MSKASRYWDKRRLERYLEAEEIQKKYKKEIEKIYKRSLKNINRDIEDVYRNYSIDTGLDKQKLMELLTKSETKKTFEELKKKGLDKYVKNNYKARINRLEQIQAQIYSKVKEIYPSEKAMQDSCFKDVIKDGYYRTIYDVEQGTGVVQTFSTISDKTINGLLNDNWSGKNYSERIWGNTDMLADDLQEIIGGAVMTGQSYAKTSRQIRDRYDVARYYADRLARTEINHFNNEIDAIASEELGFDKYVLVATLDMKTSEYCINIDHKVFKYSEKDEGVNFPPFHPNCRCTIRNYMGEYEKELSRTAVDEEGERYEVENISYNEWYNEYVVPKNRTQTSMDDKKVNRKPAIIQNNTIYQRIETDEFIEMSQVHRKNITQDIRNTIYTGDWDKTAPLNEFGYVNSSHAPLINEYMRNGVLSKNNLIWLKTHNYNDVEKIYEQYDKTIQSLKTAISNNTIPKNIELHRYLDYNWLTDKVSINATSEEIIDKLKNSDIIEKQFISASATDSSVYNNRKIDMVLKVDKGSNGFITENKMESEVIFDGGTIRVDECKIDKNGQIVMYCHLRK